MNAKSILHKAGELIEGQRSKDYGNPLEMCDTIARFWSIILDTEVTAVQVNLCMITMKIAREMNKHKEDNLIDIAGYAEILNQVVINLDGFPVPSSVCNTGPKGIKCIECGYIDLPDCRPEGNYCLHCGARL